MDKHLIENLNYANQNLKKDLLIAHKKIESLKKEISDLKSRVNNSDRMNVNKLELVEEIFEIFDKDFYLEENEDIKESDLNPFEHFMRFGYKEGRLFFKNISKETEIKVIKDFNS